MASRDELINQFSLAEEKEKIQEPQQAEVTEKTPKTENAAHHEHGKSKRSSKKKKLVKTLKSIIRDKTLNKMLNVFLFCLIANAVEYFALINYFGIPTKGVVSKIIGLLIIVGYMYSARLKPRNLGLTTNYKAILSAIRNALIFNCALIPAYTIEYFFLLSQGKKPIIRLFAYQAALSNVGVVHYIANILLLLVIETVSVIMLEILFRGILVRMGKAKFGFWQTAVIVSIFYSLWYLLIPLSKISAGYEPISLITLCLFYLIFEFFVSIKWCMCARATGSIWLGLFDHLFLNILVNLTHVVQTVPGLDIHTDVHRNYRLIIIQLISFAICFSYYKMKMRKKQQVLQSVGIRSIYSFDSLAEMSVEDVSRQAERIKTADGEIDAHYLDLLEKNRLNDEHRH